MRVRDIDIRDWYAADRFLAGKPTRKLAHNTQITKCVDNTIVVTYHNNQIACFTYNHVSVYSCGWHTTTTKQRLNCLIPSRFRIYQKDFEWRVYDRVNNTDFTFYDGMVFEYSF